MNIKVSFFHFLLAGVLFPVISILFINTLPIFSNDQTVWLYDTDIIRNILSLGLLVLGVFLSITIIKKIYVLKDKKVVSLWSSGFYIVARVLVVDFPGILIGLGFGASIFEIFGFVRELEYFYYHLGHMVISGVVFFFATYFFIKKN